MSILVAPMVGPNGEIFRIISNGSEAVSAEGMFVCQGFSGLDVGLTTDGGAPWLGSIWALVVEASLTVDALLMFPAAAVLINVFVVFIGPKMEVFLSVDDSELED